MKIRVCISNVLDTNTKITFTNNNTQFNTNGVQFILNPLDSKLASSKLISAAGWHINHENIGQTYNSLNPNLYLVFEISDKIQKLKGLSTSKLIFILNRNPNHLLFNFKNYGIVGHSFKVFPKLISAAKNYKTLS